jgi:predicted dehydrogenase
MLDMQQNENILSAGANTRREFIRKTATAAAAVAATGLIKTPVYGQATAPSANVAGANNKLTLGFVGLGNQGMNSHLKVMAANAGENNVVPVAVCDVSKTRREEGLKVAGEAAKAYEDYHQLLERKDIDVIVCATVDHWHARVSIDALNAGKHVYVEKPMTRYLGEAFEIYDAVKKTGKILQVGAQRCSVLKWHKAAEWIKAGKIGPVVSCQGSYMRNPTRYKGEWNYTIQTWATKDDVNWNLWVGNQIKAKKEFTQEDYFRWRKYYRYCAGALGDLVPHTMHPFVLATGADFPKRVACVGSRPIHADKETPGTPDRDAAEMLQVIAEFPNGMIMDFTTGTVNEVGPPDLIRGYKATLYLSGNNVQLKPEKPYTEDIEAETSDTYPPESFEAHHKNFFECIRANKQPNCNVELATRVQTIVSLAEMSERLSVMCLFDDKTRKITTSDGKELQPLTYGSIEGLS